MQKHNFHLRAEEDKPEDNKPDLIEKTEKLYFVLSNNLTKEAKSIIWNFLSLAKKYYSKSRHKKHWNDLLENLMNVINDFENDLPDRALLKLYGLQQNAHDLNEFDGDDVTPDETETK